jgi:hypothetical protein
MSQWEYKVVYVDSRGRISCEGMEFIREAGEHRTAFVRRYCDALGRDRWELVSIQPLGRWETGYFVFKRPGTGDTAAQPASAGAAHAL